MKKSLSLATILATLIVSAPLSFADDGMSSSSESSLTNPCSEKTGIAKVLCMNAESRKNNQPTAPNRMNSRAKEVRDACKDKKGLAKAVCLRRLRSAAQESNDRVINMDIPQSDALQACQGLRGGRLSACFQRMERRVRHTTNSSSSSSSSSSNSSDSY